MITANLKATQVVQEISSYIQSAQQISTRSILQYYLRDFNNGNQTQELYDAINVGNGRSDLLRWGH